MPSAGLGGRVGARFAWAGVSLSLSLPDVRWAARLADLLGLPALAATEAECEISVRDPTHLRSFATDLDFATIEDLLIWLALTIVDVLAEKARCFLLHAASLSFGDGLVLLSGPPCCGKSTLALRAHAYGLTVVGDDVVRLDLDTLRAGAVPRPFRERIAAADPDRGGRDQLTVGLPVRGRLDGEGCRLHPRANADLAEGPVTAVYLLRRHDGPGLRVSAPDRFDALAGLLAHARAWGEQRLDALPRVASLITARPCRVLSIGDNEIDRALDLIAREQAAVAR